MFSIDRTTTAVNCSICLEWKKLNVPEWEEKKKIDYQMRYIRKYLKRLVFSSPAFNFQWISEVFSLYAPNGTEEHFL